MFLKLLIGKRIITIVSAYALQQGLADIDKDKFYELIISSISRLSENEVVFLSGDLNGHVGRSSNGYEGVHGGFEYGTRNQEGEKILELGAALDMCVCNTFFKKRDSRLVKYVSGTVRTHIVYIMVKSKDRKFVKDVKVVQQHQLLLCDILMGPMKNCRKILSQKKSVEIARDINQKRIRIPL